MFIKYIQFDFFSACVEVLLNVFVIFIILLIYLFIYVLVTFVLLFIFLHIQLIAMEALIILCWFF